MNYKKAIIVLGFGLLAVQCEKIQGMEQGQNSYLNALLGKFTHTIKPEFTFRAQFCTETEKILSIIKNHFLVERNEDQNQISTDTDYAPDDSEIKPTEYICTAFDNFDFTNFVFQLYNAGYNNSHDALRKENNELAQANEELNAQNIHLNNRLQKRFKYAETIEQPVLRETIRNPKKPKSLFWNNVGFIGLGAGIASIGIWSYLHFTK